MTAENKGSDNLSYTQGGVMVGMRVHAGARDQVEPPVFDHETGRVAPSL